MQGRTRVRAAWPAWFLFTVWLVRFPLSPAARAEAPATAVKAFDQYAARIEARLGQQHPGRDRFISPEGLAAQTRLHRGDLIIENLRPADAADPPGALLHHWRGTAFVEGATADGFERLMKNFGAYPQVFAPQVLQAKILSPYSGAIPDHFSASMRVRQKHVITVVLDTTYDVSFGRLGTKRGYSVSRSTKISEISSPGTAKEHALSAAEEHGFLWRLNTYWSYEERDGGLYMQIESISLTRGIPTGLGWAVQPYVQNVPRESLEFTLRATIAALKEAQRNQGR